MNSLVAFAGRKGSGKDTAANVLINDGYETVKFADGLKTMIRALLDYVGVNEETVERMIEGDLKETNSEIFCGRSPRYVMQTLGTEWGREMIGEDFWTDLTRLRIARSSKVVITDLRFPNEAAIVEELGGVRIRIVRPNAASSGDGHASETMIDELPVEIEIENDGTVKDLETTVQEIFQK